MAYRLPRVITGGTRGREIALTVSFIRIKSRQRLGGDSLVSLPFSRGVCGQPVLHDPVFAFAALGTPN